MSAPLTNSGHKRPLPPPQSRDAVCAQVSHITQWEDVNDTEDILIYDPKKRPKLDGRGHVVQSVYGNYYIDRVSINDRGSIKRDRPSFGLATQTQAPVSQKKHLRIPDYVSSAIGNVPEISAKSSTEGLDSAPKTTPVTQTCENWSFGNLTESVKHDSLSLESDLEEAKRLARMTNDYSTSSVDVQTHTTFGQMQVKSDQPLRFNAGPEGLTSSDEGRSRQLREQAILRRRTAGFLKPVSNINTFAAPKTIFNARHNNATNQISSDHDRRRVVSSQPVSSPLVSQERSSSVRTSVTSLDVDHIFDVAKRADTSFGHAPGKNETRPHSRVIAQAGHHPASRLAAETWRTQNRHLTDRFSGSIPAFGVQLGSDRTPAEGEMRLSAPTVRGFQHSNATQSSSLLNNIERPRDTRVLHVPKSLPKEKSPGSLLQTTTSTIQSQLSSARKSETTSNFETTEDNRITSTAGEDKDKSQAEDEDSTSSDFDPEDDGDELEDEEGDSHSEDNTSDGDNEIDKDSGEGEGNGQSEDDKFDDQDDSETRKNESYQSDIDKTDLHDSNIDRRSSYLPHPVQTVSLAAQALEVDPPSRTPTASEPPRKLAELRRPSPISAQATKDPTVLRSSSAVQIEERQREDDYPPEPSDLTLPKAFKHYDPHLQAVITECETLKARERDLLAIIPAFEPAAKLGSVAEFSERERIELRTLHRYAKAVVDQGLSGKRMRGRINAIAHNFRNRLQKYRDLDESKSEELLGTLLKKERQEHIEQLIFDLRIKLEGFQAERSRAMKHWSKKGGDRFSSTRSQERSRSTKNQTVRFNLDQLRSSTTTFSTLPDGAEIELPGTDDSTICQLSTSEKKRNAQYAVLDRREAIIRERLAQFEPKSDVDGNTADGDMDQDLPQIEEEGEEGEESEESEEEEGAEHFSVPTLPQIRQRHISGVKDAQTVAVDDRNREIPESDEIGTAASQAQHEGLVASMKRKQKQKAILEQQKAQKLSFDLVSSDRERDVSNEANVPNNIETDMEEEVEADQEFDDLGSGSNTETPTCYRYTVKFQSTGLEDLEADHEYIEGRYLMVSEAKKALNALSEDSIACYKRGLAPGETPLIHSRIEEENGLETHTTELGVNGQLSLRAWLEKEEIEPSKEAYKNAKVRAACHCKPAYTVIWERVKTFTASVSRGTDNVNEQTSGLEDSKTVPVLADGVNSSNNIDKSNTNFNTKLSKTHNSRQSYNDSDGICSSNQANKAVDPFISTTTTVDNEITSTVTTTNSSEDLDSLFGDDAPPSSSSRPTPRTTVSPVPFQSAQEFRQPCAPTPRIERSSINFDSLRHFSTIAHANRHAKDVYMRWYMDHMRGVENFGYITLEDDLIERELEGYGNRIKWERAENFDVYESGNEEAVNEDDEHAKGGSDPDDTMEREGKLRNPTYNDWFRVHVRVVNISGPAN